MRILFAGDEHHYSAYALRKVIGLAMNTWADVTLMAVCPTPRSSEGGSPLPLDHPLHQALNRYREEFLQNCGENGSPYAPNRRCQEWVRLKDGLWEQMEVCRGERKDLKVRLVAGSAASEILQESRREGSDLIILGCTRGDRCAWEDPAGVPQSVVGEAGCSVLLVKEDKPIRRILACIDQASVSQESLEMINQMVTIHNAELELIGLTKGGGVKTDAYRSLIQVGDYYSDRNIQVRTRLTEVADFEAIVAKETAQDLFAFWMGKKSLMSLVFSRDWVGKFVSGCQSSVLVLR